MKLVTVIFFIISIFTFDAYSYIEANSKILPLEKRFEILATTEKITSETAQKLVGHLTLATMSLDFRLKSSAIDHLETARAEASSLLKDLKSPGKELKNLSFGKFTYDIGESEKAYYVPVWFSEGVIEEFVDHSLGLGSKVEIVNSSIIQTTVNLNMKSTLALLSKAQEEVSQNEYEKAQATLSLILKDSIISENKVTDPVLTVWSNLILTREFMENEEYKSARFTMKKAQSSLKLLEKNKILIKDGAEARELHEELNAIARSLDEKAPGFMLKAKNKTKEWILKVRRWI